MLRGMDAHSAPTFLLDPIAARQYNRPRRLRYQRETHSVGLRQRADARRRVLGLSAYSELHLPQSDFRRRTLCFETQSRAGRNDQDVRSPTRFTSSWWAAKPTATGASWAATTRRPYLWMNGDNITRKTVPVTFKPFNRWAPFQFPTSFPPPRRGEERRRGLNDLNLQRAQLAWRTMTS